MNFKILRFEEIDSTNDYLKRTYETLSEGTVIMAKFQTSGHGRLGRNWSDSKSNNLTFSLLLRPDIDHSDVPQLTLLTCASIFEVLAPKIPNLFIKWPNDLIVENRKLSGILAESIFEGNNLKAVILGVGINVNISSFAGELISKATSILIETAKKMNLDILLQKILESFSNHYEAFLKGNRSYLEVCRKHFPWIGKRVKVKSDNKEMDVTVVDLLDNGNLLVKDDHMSYVLNWGEISIIK
jgi:BirA family biotin operon repressor/biotin-[acetyl-CoA-carboxylase] ligase